MADSLLPFVKEPPTQLLCPVCDGLFQRPVIISCGHTVCENCVQKVRSCPVDNAIIAVKSGLVQNKVIESQIKALKVRCANGITWTNGETYNIDSSGCPDEIELGKISEHEAGCVYRRVGCRFCDNQTIRYKDLAPHIQTCPRRSKPVNGIKRTGSSVDAFIPDSTTSSTTACCSCGLELVKLHQENRELKTLIEKLCERVSSMETYQRESMEKIMGLSGPAESRTRNDSSREYPPVLARPGLGQSSARPRPLSSGSSLLRRQERRPEDWVMPFTFKCIGVMRGHTKAIRWMVVQDNYIITASEDGTIKVWDVTLLIRGQFGNHLGKGSIATLNQGDSHPIVWLHVYPGYSTIVTGTSGGRLRRWTFLHMKEFRLECTTEEKDEEAELTCGVASSRYLFTGTYQRIRVWSPESLSLVQDLGLVHHWVRALALSQDERLLASGAHGQVHLWHAEELQLLHTLQHDYGSIYALALTSSKIILGTYNRCVHVLDAVSKELVHSLLGQLDTNRHVLVTPSERFLLVASNDGSVQIWDFENNLLIQELKRHEDGAYVVGIAGDLIFSAGQDSEIKVYKYFKMENMR